MKRIIKFTGLLTLILFSFFYTDKVVEVIRENDNLMIELEQVSDNYKVNAINGIISGDTIKPGINGKKVNIEKSYKQMKEKGIFDENLIKYDKIVPKINMSHNQNKYIIGGNKERNMVSIVFILDNKKYLKKVEDLSISKDVMINYFVTYDYLVDNSTNITKMTNSEFYNYGSDGEYSPDNILFANNLISRITDNEAIYCLTKYKNEKVLNLCSENNLYTILPNIIVKNDPYSEIKKSLASGSIILMEMDNDSTTELGIIVDYIRGKGYDVVGLSKMLSEEL